MRHSKPRLPPADDMDAAVTALELLVDGGANEKFLFGLGRAGFTELIELFRQRLEDERER